MFCFRCPSEAQIGDYLARQAELRLSYDFAGATRGEVEARAGWNVDSQRVLLGQGGEIFQRACAAIDAWQMFPREIAEVLGHGVPRENLVVAIRYRVSVLPLWLLMAARVVYTIRDSVERGGQTVERHGFAYGTLPDHMERGEERFLVEWNRSNNCVHYDLVAISRPRHVLTWLGYPFTRSEQARFRQLSGRAMERAVR